MPTTQSQRNLIARMKLIPVDALIRDKSLLLIDDSIVRGTTMRQIVDLLKKAGATEVHVRISAPEFLWPCYYGTDIDSRDNLIACHHTVDEIAKIIGVDSLGYLSVDNVKKIACGDLGKGYCTACFDGDYPTEVPTETHKSKFECKISERQKEKK